MLVGASGAALTHPVGVIGVAVAIVIVVIVAVTFAVIATTNLTPPENREAALRVLSELLLRLFGRGGGPPRPG